MMCNDRNSLETSAAGSALALLHLLLEEANEVDADSDDENYDGKAHQPDVARKQFSHELHVDLHVDFAGI